MHLRKIGTCIDVSGRGSALDVHTFRDRVVSTRLYQHWNESSIASMIAAACLANVQHIRMLSDYLELINGTGEPLIYPLKARAHFRQWHSYYCFEYDCCVKDLIGPPPDIEAWFEVSCNFYKLLEHADRGKIAALQNPSVDWTVPGTTSTYGAHVHTQGHVEISPRNLDTAMSHATTLPHATQAIHRFDCSRNYKHIRCTCTYARPCRGSVPPIWISLRRRRLSRTHPSIRLVQELQAHTVHIRMSKTSI